MAKPSTDKKAPSAASDPLEAAKLPPPAAPKDAAPAVQVQPAPPPPPVPPAPVQKPEGGPPKVIHLPTREEYVEAGYLAEEYPRFIEKRKAEAAANGQMVQVGDLPPASPAASAAPPPVPTPKASALPAVAALQKPAPKRYRVKARTTISLNSQMVVLPADSVVSAAHYGPDLQKILDAKVPLEEIK